MTQADNIGTAEQRRRLLNEIAALGADFRAAVVAAELAESALPLEQIFFRNNSTFRRPVSRDIARVSWNDDDDFAAQLTFDLNREGIYDMLPEAVVHAPMPGKKKDNELDAKRGVILKKEERAARKFFAPIENEFAHRLLYLDTLEREVLRNDNPQRTRRFFEYFFGDSRVLSDRQVLILLYILPLSHKIRGNPRLIALAISKMLGHDVVVESRLDMHTHTTGAKVRRLGAATLGIDTVLNDRFSIAEMGYVLVIRGISVEDYPNFIGSGQHANVISFVADYFFPVAAKMRVRLDCTTAEKRLTASSEEQSSYLNFNAYI